MTEQETLDFDGKTYSRNLDGARLGAQLGQVRTLMEDQQWHTALEISGKLDYPHASVLARLTDLRKEKFGAYPVLRRRRLKSNGFGGTWEYKLGERGAGVPNEKPMLARIKELEEELELARGVVGAVRKLLPREIQTNHLTSGNITDAYFNALDAYDSLKVGE